MVALGPCWGTVAVLIRYFCPPFFPSGKLPRCCYVLGGPPGHSPSVATTLGEWPSDESWESFCDAVRSIIGQHNALINIFSISIF